MADLAAELSAAVRERSALRRISTEGPKLWARSEPQVIERYGRVYVGNLSLTVMTLSTKWITYTVYPVTPGEMATAYLKRVYDDAESPGRGRVSALRHAPGFSWNPPILAVPVERRNLAYVDIAGAYWQILSPLSPDATWLPRQGTITVGERAWWRPDEVATERRLRHAVVGLTFASSLTWWRYGKPVESFPHRPWSNPSLRMYCMQLLHAVAAEVQERFCLWRWHTDGGIVDARCADELVAWLAERWNLTARTVAVGNGAVYSSTSFVCGDKRSMDIANGKRRRDIERRAFCNLHEVRTEALREARWAGTATP